MKKEEDAGMKEVRNIAKHTKNILENILESIIIKRIVEITILALFLAIMLVNSREVKTLKDIVIPVQNIKMSKRMPEHYEIIDTIDIFEEQEAIRNEIFYGELESLAILVQAEAGNQDELGKRYVADCVLNRMDSGDFPESIEEVIYQKDPIQFSCTVDGNYEKAEWTVTEDCFRIVLEEYENRTNDKIHYFRTDKYGTGKPAFKHGAHYFSM